MKTFIDNRDGNTMASALNGLLSSYKQFGKPVPQICIATAYFNPTGLLQIEPELSHVSKVRLLLGAEPRPEAIQPHRVPGDPREPEFSRRQVNEALHQLEKGLAHDRDLLPFSPEASDALQKTIRILRSPRFEIRRYEKNFLHAKAYLFREVPTKGLIAGSSNLTRAGLLYNKELNLGIYGNETVDRGENWFDQLWNEAVPFDLAAIYEQVGHLFPPYLIYLKVLELLYGNELDQEVKETGSVPLTAFQNHGVWRAQKILEKYHGVIIADEVGLGKTFTAGEIINSYRRRRQRVLLVCPASLRDTTWREFLNRFQLLAECVSYEELANDQQIGGESRKLKNEVDEYSLVVVDEAHNYRNPDTPTRARALRALLHGRPKDLVLLSATPVNNSLWDLYHLLRYFLKQDAQLADRGIVSITDTFSRAMSEDPFSLSPDVLFPVIDATTVKRTRSFVRKHYENDTIKDEKGNHVRITFPKPKAISLHYSLENALPGIFDLIQDALAPEDNEEPRLKLARYQPIQYKRNLGDGEDIQNEALLGLIRTGLLKRFESSAKAFVGTTSKMIREHKFFLDSLAKGKVPTTTFLRELAGMEDLEDIESLFAGKELEDASGYHVEKLRRDVENDIQVLTEMRDAVSKATGDGHDPKFDALVEALVSIAEEAKKEGMDEEDARQKRKVLVFSYFEDTVNDIEDKIHEAIKRDARLAPYRKRIASASGEEYRHGVSRLQAVEGFAPVSSRATKPTDLYDLLIATDVLAEGQNLQQARHIINYDLPWNPMRLVQRHGRIDRIGSHHKSVFLRTIFPDDRLNDLLNLEERVRRKLAHAAASVGVGHAPIEGGASREQVFSESKEEIEKLYNEDSEIYERGGTASAAQTGEEYRQVLRQALQLKRKDLLSLPWKAGSLLKRNAIPGWFFCAKVGERIYLRFVRANEDGSVSENIENETGFCLRQIENKEEAVPDSVNLSQIHVYEAWDKAKASIRKAWEFESDPINLQPKVRPLNKSVAETLRALNSPKIDATKISSALDILESPWPRREENLLRGWINDKTDPEKLVEQILNIGIEPYIAPEPLPQIDDEDIHLVVWLAVQQA